MAPVKKAPKKITTKAAVPTVPLYDMTGEHLKDIDAPSHIFSVEASPMLLAQYVRVYLDRQKHAYGRTQTRSEVAGSTRKIYRQKGTGRARHGDIRAPIFVGGGITHGPSGVKRVLTMNKKQKVKALLTALSQGRNAGNIGVIDFTSVDSMKTKAFEPVLKKLGYVKGKPMVIVYGSKDNYEGLKNMVRNLDGVQYSMQSILNAYDCLRAKKVLFTKNAFEAFVDARTKEIKKETTH